MIGELAARQNPDGGFHGLEADFQSEASSVLCTLRALEILDEFGGGPDAITARAVARLAALYVPGWRSWPLVPRHDNAAPHAPWWHWSDEFDEGWGFYADNPRPSVVATLHAFSRHVERAFLDRHGGRSSSSAPPSWSPRASRRTRSSATSASPPPPPSPPPPARPSWRASPSASRPRS